jgi:peptidoglycan/LPS O-acetylase OafA/YrhL
MGCLLATARASERTCSFLSGRLFRSSVLFIVAAAIIAVLLSPLDQHVTERVRVFFPLGEYVCIALAINYLVQGGEGPIHWLLNALPMVYLGQLSYSLYLWQQPFCRAGSTLALSASWCLVPALAGAAFSYYIIEQPALRLRQRLSEHRRSQTRPELNEPSFMVASP